MIEKHTKGVMMITYARGVTDVLRNKRWLSIEQAREVYFPELNYATFYYALKKGGIPYLVIDDQCTRYKGDPKCLVKQQVKDIKSGMTWACISDCARCLKVSRTAVQQAIKRKGKCKGLMLRMVEEPKDVSGSINNGK